MFLRVLSPITQSFSCNSFPLSRPTCGVLGSPHLPCIRNRIHLCSDHRVIPTTVLSTVRAFQEAQCHAAVIRTGVSRVCTLRSASSKSDVFFGFSKVS